MCRVNQTDMGLKLVSRRSLPCRSRVRLLGGCHEPSMPLMSVWPKGASWASAWWGECEWWKRVYMVCLGFLTRFVALAWAGSVLAMVWSKCHFACMQAWVCTHVPHAMHIVPKRAHTLPISISTTLTRFGTVRSGLGDEPGVCGQWGLQVEWGDTVM